MSNQQIRRSIYHYENLISSQRADISANNAKIRELSGLKHKLSSLQTNFGDRQVVRKNKLSSLEGMDFHMKTARKYNEGMKTLLNGAGFHNAYNGLSTSIAKIDHKISQLNQEIVTANSRISSYQRIISNLRQQLRNSD